MSLRVAIVGCGPKGLFALERLLAHGGHTGAQPQVTVYEPHPYPGAGPVYDPRQPSYLRMNFAAGHIDAWPAGGARDPARRSFCAWSGVDADAFAARAAVGRYLHDAWRTVRSQADVHVRHVPRRVPRIIATASGWTILGDAHDEVLVTTGHRWPAGGAAFAAQRLARVEAGTEIWVRGFALTALDVCLALTEGRGGRFALDADPPGRYQRSGAEPARIVPFSRSGRPMLAKPRPGLFDDTAQAALRTGTDVAARRITTLEAGAGVAQLRTIVIDCAEACLLAVGAAGTADDARATLDGAARRSPRDELAASIDVAVGRARPDAWWALGHAWRALYPAIVDRFGGRGLDPEKWVGFHALARALERVAFGPPVENARKLLALADAGLVDLGHTASRPPAGAPVVDAVMPEPGAQPDDDGVVERLVVDGHARVRPPQRGVEVTADGTVVGADGTPRPGSRRWAGRPRTG